MSRRSAGTPAGYRWQPIADLPDDWRRLADADLRRLAGEWNEKREKLGSGQGDRGVQRPSEA